MLAVAGLAGHLKRSASATLLVCAASTSSAAHLIAGLGASAASMRWMMIAMSLVCLGCLVPLVVPLRRDPKRCLSSASHLMVMSVVMIAIHLLWIVMSGRSSAHNHGRVSAAVEQGHEGHAPVMLLVIAVELACLMAATVSLRMADRAQKPAPAFA